MSSRDGSAMLTAPLTPPQVYSAATIETYTQNGATISIESNPQHIYQTTSIATPNSYIYMGYEALELRPDMDHRLDSHDMSDEDEDMSDGGAPLTMTLSHAEELNAEMDMLDAEVMGADNLVGLLHESHFPSALHNPEDIAFFYQEPSHSDSQSTYDISEQLEDVVYASMVHSASDNTDLPNTISEVSQQLQHIQDGQEHADPAVVPEGQYGSFMNNSTTPFLLPSLSSASMSGVENFSQPNLVLMADVSSFSQLSVVQQPLTPPHLWGTEGSTPSPALDVLVPASGHPVTSHFPFSDVIWDDDLVSEADHTEVEDQYNLSLNDFLYNWGMSISRDDALKKRIRGPAIAALNEERLKEVEPIQRCDLRGERCDIQRINWKELGVSRLEARQMRRQTYKNYINLRFSHQSHPRLNGVRLSDHENFFKFRRMDFDHEIHLSHFQLRNLMACTSRDQVFYVGRSQILQCNPLAGPASTGKKSVVMDLTDPTVQPLHAFSGGIQISTLTAGHDVLIAGGFCGEYGMVNLRAPKSTKHTEGLITDHQNSITNHIQVHLSRNSSLPLAAFASNDSGLRILDVCTNRFIAEHKYDHAINCSAISPDQRLRVLVGDTRKVMICNSETGEILQELEGHRDYGFACDWADDGWTVATGNQDMQVKIWDARKWTTSQGLANPVKTISADIAGVRKLKFSPLGSGKRVLVAAEPADIVSVIDAETFASKQTLSFFGEVGGMDFTNNGQDIMVANCDFMRGGLMEYERCDLASEALYGLEHRGQNEVKDKGGKRRDYGYDWLPTVEEVVSHPKARRTATHRSRKAGMLEPMAPF